VINWNEMALALERRGINTLVSHTTITAQYILHEDKSLSLYKYNVCVYGTIWMYIYAEIYICGKGTWRDVELVSSN
jgi:hypothetical protein